MNQTQNVPVRTGQPEDVSQIPMTQPPVDIFENKDELLVVADVPGVVPGNVNISLHQEQLTIEARVEEDLEGTALREELHPRGYRRTFLVPQGIDGGKIHAEMKQGVLYLHLPKADHLKPRQIPVKAG